MKHTFRANLFSSCKLSSSLFIMSSQKLILQNLMQYVFDKEALEVRDLLHESIAEMIIYLKNRTLDSRAIRNEIKSQLGLDFEQSIVDEAIAKLIKDGFVREDKKKGGYFLDFSRKKQIEETVTERKTILDSLIHQFLSTYRKSAKGSNAEQEKSVLESFYQFCLKLFSSNSDMVVGMLRCTEEDIELIKNYESADAILREVLATIPDKVTQDAFSKAVTEVLKNESVLRLLGTMARNYLYFRILNLDPVCKSLQRDIMSKKILLLDTNLVMSLVLPNRATHRATAQCVTLCQKLGITLRFTQRTYQEYMDQLNQSEERFKKLHVKKLAVLAALDDDFIADYAMEGQKGSHTEWLDFARKRRLLKNTLTQWKIQEYSSIEADLDVASADPKGIVTDSVIYCAALTRNIKNTTVAQHDAYHLLLVRKIREKDTSQSILGPKYWFLTLDRSLLCVDKTINETLNRPRDMPSSIECWAFIETALPFVSGTIPGDTSHEAFSQLMKTEFRLLPARINTKRSIDIQTPKVDFDKYTVEEVRAIVDDEYVSKYWGAFLGTRFARSEDFTKKAQQKLEERVESVASSLLDKRSESEHIPRIVAGIIAILMAVAAVYGFLVQHYFEGSLVLSIFSFVFMAVSLGYKQIEVIYKELKLRLKK